MLTYLEHLEPWFSPFRLFGYITFRCLLACVLAMSIGFLCAGPILRRLQALKYAQTLRDKKDVGQLADLHASKHNTPTMGGLIIYVSLVSTTLLCTRPSNLYVWLCMGVYTVLTLLGFWDDSLKIRKKKSKGLDSKIKWLVQALLAFTVLCIALAQPTTANAIVQLWVPFYKNALLNPMPYWLLFLFFFLVMCGSSNAINLTDGIDGLAIGCTITVAMSYAILCYLAGHHHIAHYLLISHVPEAAELAVVCMALVGASLSFLWYNAHPAQVFMGDTGSLALGGLIGTIAFLAHQPFTLVVIGGIFVVEALSVILQVSSFKLRGKRIFKMSPLHHHFELSGWHENKVVIRFWIFSLLFALLGLATLKIR